MKLKRLKEKAMLPGGAGRHGAWSPRPAGRLHHRRQGASAQKERWEPRCPSWTSERSVSSWPSEKEFFGALESFSLFLTPGFAG